MAKKNPFLMTVLLVTVLLVVCVICVAALLPESSAQESPKTSASKSPLRFDSVEEFEASIRKAASGGAVYYYVPTDLPDHAKFDYIGMRDNEYISVTYSVDTSEIDTTGFSRYETERISSLICELKLYEDGTVPLISLKSNGFKPIDYQGRTIYYFEDYDPLNPDKRLIGYSIAFLQDGYCIYMHLPAIDTFENMMQYANVTRVTIE